jgi:hypothetical protein
MMKGLSAYANGTKQTWRGWQWNKIVEKLCRGRSLGPASTKEILKTKTILYLVGPHDIDREVAIKKGFSNENLIAVDIERDRVVSARNGGGFALHGGLSDVLAAWPVDRSIDGIVADFCAGIDDRFNTFAMALANVKFTKCVVAVNLLRGRDKINDSVRNAMLEAIPKDVYDQSKDCGGHWHEFKHRGYFAWLKIAGHAAEALNIIRFRDRGEPMSTTDFRETSERILAEMNPVFYSYKSGVQVFDSVVLENSNFQVKRSFSHGVHRKMLSAVDAVFGCGVKKARRQIAATMAVRTMKTQGTTT